MKKITTLFLLCIGAFFVFSGCATKLEKQLNKASKNLTNYMMDISYSDYSLSVNQSVDYINSSDTNFDKIYMHLYPNNFSEGATNKPVSSSYMDKAYPNGFSEGHLVINSLKVNDKDEEVVLSGTDFDILEIGVDELKPNERVDIEITYEVVIPNCLHRFGYGDNTINIANFYPIVAVYDGEWNLDSYHSNGDPFYSDMSNYYVNISAPNNLIMANTGNIIEKTEENNISYYQIEAKAVRDFAFVLSEKFNVVCDNYEDIEIKYYYYDDNNFAQSLKAAVDSIKTFNKLYGEYPYKTYSVVKANFIHGGMEYPNLVIVSDTVGNYNDYINVIVHETAHQWWYGLVGNNEFDYGWLDEGLTDYSTALFYKFNSDYGVDFDEVIKNTTNSYVNFVEVYTKVLGGVDTTMNRSLNAYNTEPEYVYMAYVKGVLFFDSLRENVGEEKFFIVMKKYFENYRYKNASPKDLIEVFEKCLGYEMGGFFDSWINGKVVVKRVV